MPIRPSARSWSLAGLLAALAFGSAAEAQTTGGGECRTIDPKDAVASGHATALRVDAATDAATATSTSGVSGPGSAQDSDPASSFTVPADGSIAKAGLISSTATSTVDAELAATQVAVTEVADVSLLGGVVRAQKVRAQATAATTDGTADVTGQGTSITGLVIDGLAYQNVAPNTVVALPSTFGSGSFVALYERKDVGWFPDSNHPLYRANLTITMIHVKTTNPAMDIRVAEAFSHAQTPTPFCGGLQGVAGTGYVAKLQPPGGGTHTVGYTEIPVTGGTSHNFYTDLSVPASGETLTVGSAESRSIGAVELGVTSNSDVVVKLADVCLRMQGEADCVVRAEAIRSESHSRAFADTTTPGDVDAFSWGNVVLTNLTVAGHNVCNEIGLAATCTPPKNAPPMTIDGITITLNQRLKDLDPEGHTEYWVYAVILTSPEIGKLTLGRSYSGADYGTHDDNP